MAKLSVALTSELLAIPNAPSPREAHSTVYLGDGRLLVFGGGSSVEEEAQQYNDVVSGCLILILLLYANPW